MLQAMRSGAHSTLIKIVLFSFMTLATFGLVFMDVQGVFQSGVRVSSVAEVDGANITPMEFDRLLRMSLQQQRMTAAEAWQNGSVHNVLIGEIQRRLLTKAAWDAGINVSDEQVSVRVREILKPLVDSGVSEKDALDRLLRSQGMSEAALVDTLRREMGVELLMKAIALGATAPKQMVDDAWAYRYEQRIGEHFTITDADAMKMIKAPTEDELKSYYQSVKRDFMRPEYRALAVVALSVDDIKDEVGVSEDMMRAAYDERQKEYATTETRMIAQAILPDEATAGKVAEAARNGKSLEAAVKTAGGGKGRFVAAESTDAQSLTPQELSGPAFSAKQGAITAPVKTPFGWHVLFIKNVKPAEVKSFDKVKEELRKELTKQAAEERLYKVSEKISDALAGGASLKDVADEFSLAYKTFSPVDAAGKGVKGENADFKKIPQLDKVLQAAFSLPEANTPSSLIEMQDGSFVMVEALDIQPEQERPLKEIASDVTKAWMREKSDAAAMNMAQKLVADIEKSGAIAGAAASAGKTAQTSEALKRADFNPAQALPPGFVPMLFSIGREGGATVLKNPEGGVTVIRLKKVMPAASPSGDKNKEEIAGLQSIVTRSLQQDLLEQYRMWLSVKAGVEVNNEALERLYAPKEDDTADVSGEDVE